MPDVLDPQAHVQLTLRDYQIDALKRVDEAEARGIRRPLIVAATGLGKTVMFAALAERRGGRALVLVHRDELVRQAVKKIREVWPGVTVGVVKGQENQVGCHVVVASIQTLARQRRLNQLLAPFLEGMTLLNSADPFGLIIVDEAHHAAAESYTRVLDALAAWDPLILGVTATPDRGDGRGLDGVFEEVVASYDILWGIRHQYLSDLRGVRVEVAGLDMDQVKVTAGDYNQGQAGRMMERAGAERFILKAWQKHADERKTLVFTPTVETASRVAAAFAEAGVAAAMVHGGTPMDERSSILRRFSSGEIRVLANCAVLTEGYDEPSVACVIVARPTKSRGLYVQMVGRGTRRHPDKTDCLVLDVVGASEEHTLVTIPSLFGVETKHRKRAQDGTTRVGEIMDEQREELVRLGRLRAEEADLFAKARRDGIQWIPVHSSGAPREKFVRPMGKGHPTVVLAQVVASEDVWTAGLQFLDGTKRVLIREVSQELAQGVAEDYVRKLGSAKLVDPNARWRKNPPTNRQLALAGRWHLKVGDDWTAGELSDRLDRHIARIKEKAEAKAREKAAAERSAKLRAGL